MVIEVVVVVDAEATRIGIFVLETSEPEMVDPLIVYVMIQEYEMTGVSDAILAGERLAVTTMGD
jgi:hypothetical protein